MVKMTPEERDEGMVLFEKVWSDIQGYSPDQVCFALLSVLATLIDGAAKDPPKTAERLARNLIRAVERPPAKSAVN